MAENGIPEIIASNSTSQSLPAHYAHIPHDSALSVGSSKAEEDASKIRDLEDEVKILAERANTASQRFADYENEIRVLEAKLRQEQRKNSGPNIVKTDSPNDVSPTTSQDRPGISRFGSFIGSRKASPLQQNGTLAPSNGSREKELEEKLIQEQTTRIAAEKKVKEVNAEIEDLSATLFQQANEMVATERKEKADLTEKNILLREQIQKLEVEQKTMMEHQQKEKTERPQTEKVRHQQKASLDEQQNHVTKSSTEKLAKENERLKEKLRRLEQRETERKKRLDRLEAASKRVERVKAMLQPP